MSVQKQLERVHRQLCTVSPLEKAGPADQLLVQLNKLGDLVRIHRELLGS